MDLDLAGWRVALKFDPPELEARLGRRYAAFLGLEASRPVDLTIEIAAEDAFDAHGSLLHAQLTISREDFLLDGPNFCGMIGPLRGYASLRVRSDAVSREIEYFLRVTLGVFAYHSGGLLLHSAALRLGGRTHLFVGQSGSGKSTVVALARALRQATALGDDLILLRREDAGWRAYGTPFWNLEAVDRTGQVDSGRVAAIYALVQDTAVFVAPMSVASATAELVANCPVVNALPALLPGLLDRCGELARSVRVGQLHFRRDDSFWDVISDATDG